MPPAKQSNTVENAYVGTAAPPIGDGEEDIDGPLRTAPVRFECPRHPWLKVLKKGERSVYLRFVHGVLVTDDPDEIAQLRAKHIRNRYGVYPADVPAREYRYAVGDVKAVWHSQDAYDEYLKTRDKGAASGFVGWNF